MKVVNIRHQSEQYIIPKVDGLAIQVHSFDITGQVINLQQLVDGLATLEFDAVVLSASLGGTNGYTGLELCMRVRLSYSSIREKAFSTIFVFITKPVEDIIKEQIAEETELEPTGTVLLTTGVFTFDNESFFEIIATPKKNYNLLNLQNYRASFLNVIRINRPPQFGNHSLANLFGAIRLAEITGHADVLNSNDRIKYERDKLYFKYKTAFNLQQHDSISKKQIPSSGKRILLIDDKENFGWSAILRVIFKNAKFEYVESGENFINRATKRALEEDHGVPKWDLILLDLRLLDSEDSDETANKHASFYSGAELLRIIKEKNRGIQVIVFTASNKAWNMRQLLRAPFYLDGYFIKEAPLYELDFSFSATNFEIFKNDVSECLAFSEFKRIVAYCAGIKLHLTRISNTGGGVGFQTLFKLKLKNEIESQINQAIELLSFSKGNEDNYSWAFLSFYKIFELLNDYFIEYSQSLQTFVFKQNNKPLMDCKYEKNAYSFVAVRQLPPVQTSTSVKLYNILSEILKYSPVSDIKMFSSIYNYQVKRRKFIHPKDLNDYRKLSVEDSCDIARDLEDIIMRIS